MTLGHVRWRLASRRPLVACGRLSPKPTPEPASAGAVLPADASSRSASKLAGLSFSGRLFVNADRVVRVSPERLPGWIERFTTRHGDVVVTPGPDVVVLTAADGARAALTIPYPPLAESPDPLAALLEHAGRDRLLGALLVRRGGYAVGVFAGSELRSSKVGHGYVQGRTKAGGWSQQRFARRRSNQADRAYAAAAEAAYAVLGPVAADLVAVVGGGTAAAWRPCWPTRGWHRCGPGSPLGCYRLPTRGWTCSAASATRLREVEITLDALA